MLIPVKSFGKIVAKLAEDKHWLLAIFGRHFVLQAWDVSRLTSMYFSCQNYDVTKSVHSMLSRLNKHQRNILIRSLSLLLHVQGSLLSHPCWLKKASGTTHPPFTNRCSTALEVSDASVAREVGASGMWMNQKCDVRK